jgi:subtilisin family serine protease
MRKNAIWLLTLLVFVFGVTVNAAVIDESLQYQLDRLTTGETVEALVFFEHQADMNALDEQLKREKATLGERNRRSILALQEAATLTQPVVIDFLESLKAQGSVKYYRPFWIANMIRVEADRVGIEALAARQDLSILYANFEIEEIEPVTVKDDGGLITSHEVGLDRINAPAAWEQGWTGAGRVVMNIDTGVDGNHPALIETFRGDVDGDGDVDESWFDPYDTHYPEPRDDHGHGTHTMGTICGRTSSDTIGVAVGAQWIAAGAIDRGGGIPRTVADAIASFEWAVDPDGDPETQDNPDAIGNSWGVTTGHGYPPCDRTFWQYIDACEVAGSAVIFSAGNEGPGPNSLRRPADRGTTPYNCFAVGAVDGNSNSLPIAGFSSRGPSDCGPNGEEVIKPEVVAPGVNVRSSTPGGGYASWSGTSMASPHVTGAIGVIRSVNPDLDVDTIKEILMSTAYDSPSDHEEGEDNNYGHGVIDLYEACLIAQSGYGFVHGEITDSDGIGIGGALLEVIDSPRFTTADENGHYEIGLPADTTYSLRASFFGYLPEEAEATVAPEETTYVDFMLQMAPSGSLHGTVVSEEDGSPIENATVMVVDAPIDPVETDENGYYIFDALPGDQTHTIRATASGFGFGQDDVFVPVDGDAELNFALTPFESFENNNGRWEGEGVWEWGEPNSGPGSAYDGLKVWATVLNGQYPNNVDDGLETTSYLVEESSAAFTFYHWYNIESGWDGGNVSISTDGGNIWNIIEPEGGYPDNSIYGLDGDPGFTGTTDWTQAIFPIGDFVDDTVRFRFRFGTDGSVTRDGWYLDAVVAPGTTPVYGGIPIITFDPTSFYVELEQGSSTDRILTIGNDGDTVLYYSITPVTDGRRILQDDSDDSIDLFKTNPDQNKNTRFERNGEMLIVTYDGPKLETPDKSNPPMTADFGGPDEFGYTWIDSNEPDGPEFDWVDISGIGEPLSFSDDQNQGPFSLGFTMPFYDGFFNSIRICSNGFISFTSDATDWTNDPIPYTEEPDNLVAPFWDDLDPSSGGMIYFYTNNVDTAIVEWENVPHYQYSGEGLYTFEAILLASGDIVYQYASVEGEVASNTIGIENSDASIGLQVVYDSPYVANELAVRINIPTFWLTVDPMSGNNNPGESSDFTVTFDASELDLGEYTGYLRIDSNDPADPTVTVGCTLVVEEQTGIDDASTEIPAAFSLDQNYPNPFNPATDIGFALPSQAEVELVVYDMLGRQVRSLVNGKMEAGYHSVTWDGTDNNGRSVSSGVYFYSIKAGDFSQSQKMIMLK